MIFSIDGKQKKQTTMRNEENHKFQKYSQKRTAGNVTNIHEKTIKGKKLTFGTDETGGNA
jgi:hypothetical protein